MIKVSSKDIKYGIKPINNTQKSLKLSKSTTNNSQISTKSRSKASFSDSKIFKPSQANSQSESQIQNSEKLDAKAEDAPKDAFSKYLFTFLETIPKPSEIYPVIAYVENVLIFDCTFKLDK